MYIYIYIYIYIILGFVPVLVAGICLVWCDAAFCHAHSARRCRRLRLGTKLTVRDRVNSLAYRHCSQSIGDRSIRHNVTSATTRRQQHEFVAELCAT